MGLTRTRMTPCHSNFKNGAPTTEPARLHISASAHPTHARHDPPTTGSLALAHGSFVVGECTSTGIANETAAWVDSHVRTYCTLSLYVCTHALHPPTALVHEQINPPTSPPDIGLPHIESLTGQSNTLNNSVVLLWSFIALISP